MSLKKIPESYLLYGCREQQTVEVENNKFKMPAADVTVTAEFVATEYDITYELDGGANAEGNPDTYTVEDAIHPERSHQGRLHLYRLDVGRPD